MTYNDFKIKCRKENIGDVEMAWESANNSATSVVAIRDGEERSFNFGGETKLKDAVSSISSQMGFNGVLVKCDGRIVEPEEGETAISDFSKVEVMPKIAGA